jgi:glyoxylase-like metal-dependent hydrolase (beta-lactamase superfamily II)
MSDLQPLSEDAFLFAGAVNSVIYISGSSALVVDTGLDESHARKLLRALQEAGLTPTAILNTHSHADHHGGNAFILKRFPGLPISAPPLEAAIIRHPVLEPLYLYGALPPRALQTKFLLAPSSPAQGLEAGHHTLGGVEVEVLDAPGHAVQMCAVRRGSVLYAADALFGQGALSKHPLTFCADSAAQKASASGLLDLPGVMMVVPGHGEPTPDLAELVQANLDSLERTTAAVLRAVQQGAASTDELLARVCDGLRIEMTNAGAVVLNRSVVAAHLSELLAQEQVALTVEGNRMLFGPV